MSLRFCFGPSGSGKSHRIYEEIMQRAAEEPGRNFLIIVPDQFTMQTQKDLVMRSDRDGILNIDVLSFGRLSHRILEEVGTKEMPVLDDTGKSLVLQKVAADLKEQLPAMGSLLHKQGYIHEVKSAISEFMQYGISTQDMDKLISGTASYIAAIPDVAAMLENGYPDSTVTRDLDSLSSNIPDINVIVISDKNGLRFYHTNRLKTGDSYVAGDEDAILAGSDPYITTGYGTHGMQRRAFHAVKNSGGEIVGFVMVSLFTATLSAQHRSLLFFYIIIFLIMMIVSISLTHTMFSLLRDSLLGYDPEELVNIYTRQDEVMNMIDEGLAATDLDGRILFANQKVSTILGRPANDPPLTHLTIQELFPQTAFDQVIKTGESVTHESISFAGRQLIVKEVPIHGRGKQARRGVLIVLFDRTDLLRLSDELSGAHNMLDTLRAFNHEFLNKLHIILGYLQTGEIQQAMNFITNSSLVSSQSVRETANCIRVPKICALVIGKMMHAAELGIRLQVSADSTCRDHDLLIPVEGFVTILGNLMENAIEELSHDHTASPDVINASESPREIHIGIYCRPDVNIITCEDTGHGIQPQLLDHIFEKGVSSKGENRGTGLFLVHELMEEYGGTIDIDTEPGEGTCFTLTFTRKETESNV